MHADQRVVLCARRPGGCALCAQTRGVCSVHADQGILVLVSVTRNTLACVPAVGAATWLQG